MRNPGRVRPSCKRDIRRYVWPLMVIVVGALLAGCASGSRPVTEEMKQEALQMIARDEMPDTGDWALTETDSGIRWLELTAGTGPTAWYDDDVKVHYLLWDASGKTLEVSRPQGIGFEFGFTVGERRVVAGWEEIIQQMNAGSEVLAVIPWRLAYGRNGRGEIPGRTDLVFYIKLLRIR
jgi:FKBP-type peptidyl-prolyl cis-trans isomerase